MNRLVGKQIINQKNYKNMKTTMKLMMMAVLMVFVMTSVHAQDPFYLYKEGCKVTFVDKNSKGKITSYSTLTVTKESAR